MFHLWLQVFLNLRDFSNFFFFFANDCVKKVLLKIFAFLSSKRGKNHHFTMAKDSIC